MFGEKVDVHNDTNLKGEIKIGIINIDDLLSIVYDVKVNQKQLNFYYFNTFMGKFNYEEAFNK